MGIKLGELFFEIGGKNEGFIKVLDESKKKAALLAAEVTATLFALDRFVEKSTSGAISLTNLSRQAGMTAQDLQHWGLATSLSNAGIKADEASAQVAGFATNLYKLQHGLGGDASGFQGLAMVGRHVSWYGKNAMQVLGDLREQMKGLTDQQSVNVLERFGLGPQFLDVMRLSDEAFKKLGADLVLSPEKLNALDQTRKEINQLKNELVNLQSTLVSDFAPELHNLISFLSDGAQSFKEMGHGAKEAAAAILLAFSPVIRTIALATLDMNLLREASTGKSDPWAKGVADWLAEPIDKKSGKLYRQQLKDFDNGSNGVEYLLPPPPIDSVSTARGDGAASVPPSPSSAPQGNISKKDFLDSYGGNDGVKSSLRETAASPTFNNTYHVHGDNAGAIAHSIVDTQQQQFNNAVNDQNNGPR